ncbi:MAG: site-specific DNA-methyltransferase [Flaviaesturariibacter sp.]|nr:site-specific DNA-methyltransferase [Flaviaesturariibacter sp.]
MTLDLNKIWIGDVLKELRKLPDGCVHCVVTSPPYWGLRDYGMKGQLGLEKTPQAYIRKMVLVFREVRRVLRNDGTLWLNIGDSYASVAGGYSPTGSRGANATISANTMAAVLSHKSRNVPSGLKPKDLVGIPWMLAFALRKDGWFLRQDIIWHKPNPMPESVTDRCTKAHEHIFLLAKSPIYHFEAAAIAEPAIYRNGRAGTFDREGNAVAELVVPGQSAAQHRPRKSVKRGDFNGKTNELPGREAFRAITETRNKRSVWSVPTATFNEAHFATFPEAIPEQCIKAGCPEGGVVLDPFFGAGTTGLVARKLNRNFIGIELNPKYAAIAEARLQKELGLFI